MMIVDHERMGMGEYFVLMFVLMICVNFTSGISLLVRVMLVMDVTMSMMHGPMGVFEHHWIVPWP